MKKKSLKNTSKELMDYGLSFANHLVINEDSTNNTLVIFMVTSE